MSHLWDIARANVMLAGLAEASGLGSQPVAHRAPTGVESLGAWLEEASLASGFEAEPVELRYGELERALAVAAPSVFVVPSTDGPRLLAVLRRRGRRVEVLAPDGGRIDVRIEDLRAAFARPHEDGAKAAIEPLLSRVSPRRRDVLRRRLTDERLASVNVGHAWMLRRLPEHAMAEARARSSRRLALLVGLRSLEVAIIFVRWWIIGKGALEGAFSGGWLGAWALLFCSQAVIDVLVEKVQGEWGIDLATALQRQLLAGVTLLPPDTLRSEGTGALLGRTIEADALGELALTGGLAMLLSVVDVVAPLILLLVYGTGHAISLAFVVTVVAVAVLGVRYFRRRREWTTDRLRLTTQLVEQMVGHRTQLVQGRTRELKEANDLALRDYLGTARSYDAGAAALAIAPRGWVVIGSLVLAVAFVRHASVAEIAILVGALVYGQQALRSLVLGMSALGGAGIAWERVRPFFEVERERAASPVLSVDGSTHATGSAAVETRHVAYRYRKDATPALHDASVVIAHGDRVLLEGPSGAGKSTLAALLAGLRAPTGGIILAGGLDQATLGGTGWRRRVVLAPQFHDNHVFAESLAFNLLMGRAWPPSPRDLDEALATCHALGLGKLLEKMPGGICQMVGDTGWQLSHGERSRMFLARALLQRADVVILDESFGALDPETLKQCVLAVVDRVATLVVIAHP